MLSANNPFRRHLSSLFSPAWVLTYLTVGLVVFIIVPLIMGIASATNQIIAAKQQTASLDSQMQMLSKFKAQADQYDASFKRVDQSFVDPANPVAFISFLEESAAANGVAVSVNVSSSNKQPGVLGFQVAAQGNFTGTMDFLETLENGPYPVSFTAFDIAKPTPNPQQKTPPGQLSAMFEVTTLSK